MFKIVLVLAVRLLSPEDGSTVEKEFTVPAPNSPAYESLAECRGDLAQRKWFAAGANRAIQLAEEQDSEIKAIAVRVKCVAA